MSLPFPDNDVFERIRSGEPTEAVLLSLLRRDERDTLARCSVVRQFNIEMFHSFLRAGDIDLQELLDRGWVEGTDWPGDDDGDTARYWLAGHVRDYAWHLWWPAESPPDTEAQQDAPPDGLRELCGGIAAYCAGQADPASGRGAWDIERLRQLAVADADAASRLFEQLYWNADGRFDLAYCQDTIDALNDPARHRFLPMATRERLSTLQRRITARAMRSVEYYQTRPTRYLEREEVQQEFTKLLSTAEDAPWLLQLHGYGGMGKTTLLHWFLARACLAPQEPTRAAGSAVVIACARINCDTLDPATVLDRPWLLLIEAAEQLNRQLPNPFGRLLVSFREYRGALRRPASAVSALEADQQQAIRNAEEAERLFCESVPAGGPPIVIAVDGLDRLTDQSRFAAESLHNLASLAVRVHEKVPGVRIVVAGRHDLRFIPALALTSGVSNVPVPSFQPEETERYLTHHRGITDQGKVAAVHEMSRGLPMVVALYADLMESEFLTDTDITQDTDPRAEYLITRILGQISNIIVRHALLYSVVVPAALDFGFFRDVMLPTWRAQKASAGIPDDLAVQDAAGNRPRLWPVIPSADDEPQIRQLWANVVGHASMATWITAEDEGANPKVVVHDEVRPKLRRIVRGFEETFLLLHQTAVRHYRNHAAAWSGPMDADGWLMPTKLASYHLFQAKDPGAGDAWRLAIEQARLERRFDWARELTEYILHPDFRDGHDQPSVVPVHLRYEANVRMALQAARDAGRLPGHPGARPGLWHETAERYLANAERIAADMAPGAVHSSELVSQAIIISALIKVESRKAAEALTLLQEVTIASGPVAGDKHLVRARAHALLERDLKFPDMPETAHASYGEAYLQYTAPQDISYIALEAASWLLDIDRPDRALDWCSRARTAGADVTPIGPGTQAELHARALLALGRPGSALDVVDQSLPETSSTRAHEVAAEAQLALRRPLMALLELRELPEPMATPGADDSIPAAIERDLLLARVYGELLDIDNADDCFNVAQSRLTRQSHAEYQARINVARALFELRVTGSVRQAEVYLAPEFESAAVPPAGPTWTSLQLARAELADRQANDDKVQRILREVRGELTKRGAPASRLVQASLTGLATTRADLRSRGRFVPALTDDLRAIAPGARLALLTDLLRCRRAGSRKSSATLRSVATAGTVPVDVPESGQAPSIPDLQDMAHRDLTVAELFRVTGDRRAAARHRARAVFELRDDPFARWELLAASREATDHGEGLDAEAIRLDPYLFYSHYQDYPLLFGAFMAEFSARHDPDNSLEEVHLWLTEAQRQLSARPTRRRTIWHARFYDVLAGRARHHGAIDGGRELAELAAEIRAELGEYETRAEPLDRPVPPGTAASASPVDHRAGVTTIVLSDAEHGPADRGPSVRVGIRTREDEESPRGVRVRDFTPPVLRPVTLALEWGRQAGQGLPRELTRPDNRDGQVFGHSFDIRAEFGQSALALAAHPWELADPGGGTLAGSARVRYVFRGPDDPLSARHQRLYLQRAVRALYPPESATGGGSRERDAVNLEKFLELRRLPPDPAGSRRETWTALRNELDQCAQQEGRPVRVRVIQPIVGGSLMTARELDDHRDAVMAAYRAAFHASPRQLDIRVLYGDEVARLYAGAASTRDKADVLHVCTVMRATEQMPILGLNAEKGPPLTAPELDLLIQRLTDRVPPLVILDIQALPSLIEARQQLLLRNRFAHQLLALGSVTTIIASGLARRHAPAQRETLTGHLANGQSAADICRAIQLRPVPQLDGTAEDLDGYALAFPATALFTSLRPDTLIAPGLIS
jgi:hypothetical protein